MAYLIVRQWELAVLRVRLDVSGPEAEIACHLVDYASGAERTHGGRRYPPSAFGLTDSGPPSGRLTLPDDLLAMVAPVMGDALDGEAALWIRLEPPYGYLGAVPWEDLAADIGVPIFRVPDRMPVPTEFGQRLSLALAIDASGARWGADHVVELFAALQRRLDEARTLKAIVDQKFDPTLRMDVFADAVTAAGLRGATDGLPGLRVHRPTDAVRVHRNREKAGVAQFRGSTRPLSDAHLRWADWIADGLGGRAVRALHVVTDAGFDGDVPCLTISADPARPGAAGRAGRVTGGELGLLADALGASTVSIGSAPTAADAATRMIVDALGQHRPGATLYSSLADDPHAEALAGAHLFLFDRTVPGLDPPTHRSLFGYIQPEALRPVIAGTSATAVDAPVTDPFGGPDDQMLISVPDAPDIYRPDTPASWSGLTITPADAISGALADATEVPAWVAATSRFLETRSLTLLPPGSTPSVPSKAGYDAGTREALDWIRGLVNRLGES